MQLPREGRDCSATQQPTASLHDVLSCGVCSLTTQTSSDATRASFRQATHFTATHTRSQTRPSLAPVACRSALMCRARSARCRLQVKRRRNSRRRWREGERPNERQITLIVPFIQLCLWQETMHTHKQRLLPHDSVTHERVCPNAVPNGNGKRRGERECETGMMGREE